MKWKIKGRWLWLALLLVVGAAGLAFWLMRSSLQEPVAIKVASPAYHDVSILVTTNGEVQPMSEFQARANFPGMVDKVFVELGAKVAAGQMLVTLKDPFAESRVATARSEVSTAEESNLNVASGGTQEEEITLRGDLKHAREAKDEAQRSMDALVQLKAKGAASAAEVESAHDKLTEANTTLATLNERATQRYRPADRRASRDKLLDAQAALGAAQMSFNNAHITSPISGTVYAVSVAAYDFVPMGADLLRIANLDQMQIRSYFDEPEVGKLKAGMPVTVTWEGRPGQTWHGHIRQAPVGAVPMGSRSVAECLITLDDAGGHLLPNTHVVVTVPTDVHHHVLTVPRQALLAEGDTAVYRVVDGKLRRTPVRVGLVSLDLVEIVDGVTPQDVVALHAVQPQTLSDGMPVTVTR